MYVADNGASTKGIHRFDPITGAYFGRFGTNQLVNPMSIALGQNGLIHVLDIANLGQSFGSRIRTFEGSTGQFVQSVTIAEKCSTDSKLYAHPDGRFTVTTGSSYNFPYALTYSSDGSLLGTSGLASGIQAGGLNAIGDRMVMSSGAGGTYYAGQFTESSGTAFLHQISFAGSGNLTNLSVQGNYGVIGLSSGTFVRMVRTGNSLGIQAAGPVPNLTSLAGLAMGHGTLVHGAGMSGSNFRISSFDGSNFDNFGYYEYATQVKSPTDVAMVVAPEPATLTLVGLGIATMIRRRRKSA